MSETAVTTETDFTNPSEAGVAEAEAKESLPGDVPEEAKGAYAKATEENPAYATYIDQLFDTSYHAEFDDLNDQIGEARHRLMGSDNSGATSRLDRLMREAARDVKDKMIHEDTDIDVYIDRLRAEIESSLDLLKADIDVAEQQRIEQRALAHEALGVEAAQEAAAKEARVKVEEFFEEARNIPAPTQETLAQAAPTVSQAPSAATPKLTEAPQETQKKLGFFEKRRYSKGLSVYGAINQLTSQRSEAPRTEQEKSDAATAENYRDAFHRMGSEKYVPSGKAIKAAEQYLQKLQDNELKARAERNPASLTKADKKRLEKLSS